LQIAFCRLQVAGCKLHIASNRLQVAGSRVHIRIKVEDWMLKFDAFRFKLEYPRCSFISLLLFIGTTCNHTH